MSKEWGVCTLDAELWAAGRRGKILCVWTPPSSLLVGLQTGIPGWTVLSKTTRSGRMTGVTGRSAQKQRVGAKNGGGPGIPGRNPSPRVPGFAEVLDCGVRGKKERLVGRVSCAHRSLVRPKIVGSPACV